MAARRFHNAVISWMHGAGILSIFLRGVDHRQGTRCCAMTQHPCFKEVRCARVGQLTKICVRVPTIGGRLHAIGRRYSLPCFAITFRSDGKGMVQLSGSGDKRGYPDGEQIFRLTSEPTELPGPCTDLTTAATQHCHANYCGFLICSVAL
jgi:hypothetical protein